MAVRAALGAAPSRLLRQLVTESLLVAVLGGLAGVAVTAVAIDVLVAVAPVGTPRLGEVTVNPRVLAFALGATLLTGLLFGLAPAFHARRVDLTGSLKEGGTGSASARSAAFRRALVTAELALALMLLVGAGLLLRSLGSLHTVDLGFEPSDVLVASVAVPRASHPAPADIVAFYDNAVSRLRALHGVAAAGASSSIPFSGGDSDMSFDIDGQPPPADPASVPVAWYRLVEPGYFRVMDMRLVAGRQLAESDRAGAPRAAVINESLARQYWSGVDPIGRRVSFQGPEGPWFTIVGIVADTRHRSPGLPARGELFLPYRQFTERFMNFTVRAPNAAAMGAAVRAAVRDIDPNLPVASLSTLEEMRGQVLAPSRLVTWLLGVFAAAAVLLAAIGIYGLMADAVGQRTREIGIRLALGARGADVMALVLRQSFILAAAGIVIGGGLALLLGRLLTTLLFGVTPGDPVTFVATAVLLVLVAVAGAYLPARRAARIDPIRSLRTG